MSAGISTCLCAAYGRSGFWFSKPMKERHVVIKNYVLKEYVNDLGRYEGGCRSTSSVIPVV